MSDLLDLRTKRPDMVQVVKYTLTPEYYKHQPYEDKLAILVCQIKIWQPKGVDWFNIPSGTQPLIIRECESVEVTDSAKELMNKAMVRFPRGTVIQLSSKRKKPVKEGDETNSTQHTTTLQEANNSGDIISTKTALYKDNSLSTTSIAMNYDDKGMIDFNRTKTEPALLNPNDVAIGNRIEIRLGYAYSEKEFKKMNTTIDHPKMDVVFTGFITSISANTPLVLDCVNMAHVLNTISAPNIQAGSTVSVQEFLNDDGKYHLLKGTGIPLSESSKGLDIEVSGGSITDNLTVADVLGAWLKGGVNCMIETDNKSGKVQLRVGWGFNTGDNGGKLPNTDKRYLTYNGGNNTVKLIQFDWDVAQDKLTLKHVDKKYLAVEAQGMHEIINHSKKEIRYFKLTVRKDPDSDSGEFQIINHRDLTKKKHTIHKDGTQSNKCIHGNVKDKVNLSKYIVAPYVSPTKNITEKKLAEEAKQYWHKYNPNGISGAIEIFGDIYIRPTEIIGLIDPRQPEKNGYYYVEAVNTTFGINGYRRELTLPYKLASFAKPVQII